MTQRQDCSRLRRKFFSGLPDQRKVLHDPLQVHDLTWDELGDGQADDVLPDEQSALATGDQAVTLECMTRSKRRRRDTPPPQTGLAEKDVLVSFLDYLRSSVVAKVHGVAEPAVRTPGVASGTNLLGLLKHLTHVERYTFLGEKVTDWPATFHASPDETVDGLVQAYRDAVAHANRVIAACDDLESAAARPTTTPKDAPSMRWALAHMIEETGRHAGHLDILRELIDGATGR